jgi:hypothetical protein
MSRLSKRLARKRSNVPGEQARLLRLSRLSKKLEQARAMRETACRDEDTAGLCDTLEQARASGFTVRHGGPEPRRWPLHEAWGGKEPPETS